MILVFLHYRSSPLLPYTPHLRRKRSKLLVHISSSQSLSPSSVKSVTLSMYPPVRLHFSIRISTYDPSVSSSQLQRMRPYFSITLTVAIRTSWWRWASPHAQVSWSPSSVTLSAIHFCKPESVPISCQMIFFEVEFRRCSTVILFFSIVVVLVVKPLGRPVFFAKIGKKIKKMHFIVIFFCEKFWRLTKKHYLCTRNQERWRDSSAG